MLSRDHYAVLGVAPDADSEAISAAFRRLSRRYHPDLNPGDAQAQAAFERLELAHSVLTDSRDRARYDREGRPAADEIEVLSGSNAGGEGTGRDAGSYAELFRQLCDHARRSRPQRGGDIHAAVACRLLDAERGRRTTVDIRRLRRCSACAGVGRLHTRDTSLCPTCNGAGKEIFGRGVLAVAVACADCGGDGLNPGASCEACHGSGLTGRQETVAVQIPPGVSNGQEIRVSGGGHPGPRGGPSGDLVTTVSVQAEPGFERSGPHLITSVPVSVSEAVLGARVEIPVLDGAPAIVRVPPGTRGGARLRVRGRGLEMANGRRGDLIAVVDLWLPDVVDEDVRGLIRAFGERTGGPDRGRNERATVQR